MGNKKWEVEFYEKSDGECPTEEFLLDLEKSDKKIVVLIMKALNRLEQYGEALRRPYVDILRDKIWELRVKTHHGLFRLLYFFFDEEGKIIVTHGISKKSGDVPDAEIEKAIEYRKDYLERKQKGKFP